MLPWLPCSKKANSQKMLIFATKFQNDWDVKGKGHSLYLENKMSLCVEISPMSVKLGKKIRL